MNRFVRTLLTVITIPLLFGGLIAAGESGDARVLLCGAVSMLALGASMTAGSSRGVRSDPSVQADVADASATR
jgi:hypothetical protein